MRHTHPREVEKMVINKRECCHNYCELRYPADKYRRDEKMDLMDIGDENFQYHQYSIRDKSNSFS
jgi:hypothetical protein